MSERIITIVMPFYNRANLVVSTIRNICEQTFCDWELLVIDDGSEESDYKLVSQICESDSRILLVKRSDNRSKGAQSCRNIGLELAQGKYIVFFDSDDFIPKYCIQQRVDYMEDNQNLDFAVFPYAEYETNFHNPEVVGGYRFYPDDLRAFISRTLPFMVWSNIYRTQSLRKHSIQWDTHLKSLQDAHFNISVLCAGLKYEYAENSKIDYFNRTASKGASISKGIYSLNHFDSHVYYSNTVRNAVSNKKEMVRPLRDGCIYIYSIMMHNYSRQHCHRLIASLSEDKLFYVLTMVKDYIYRNIFLKLHVGANVSRWLLFPRFSLNRKIVLKKQRTYCSIKAHSHAANSLID